MTNIGSATVKSIEDDVVQISANVDTLSTQNNRTRKPPSKSINTKSTTKTGPKLRTIVIKKYKNSGLWTIRIRSNQIPRTTLPSLKTTSAFRTSISSRQKNSPPLDNEEIMLRFENDASIPEDDPNIRDDFFDETQQPPPLYIWSSYFNPGQRTSAFRWSWYFNPRKRPQYPGRAFHRDAKTIFRITLLSLGSGTLFPSATK